MSGTQAVATWLGRELSGGRYRVEAQLGEGGMGTVFRAWDKNLSTEVVVKVPHASMLQDAEFAARFAREISSLVKLSHPHIVKISDVGDHDRLPFAVMQFLPGGSLEDRQKSDPAADVKPLPPESLKSWLVSIADALDFVHSQGYIHRDVKPANILFDAHGHAYLSDFGIAKSAEGGAAASSKTLTGYGMVIGTPEYMAPELIMGQTCDGRVDQYALAVTVFEILAGRRPFEDATSTAVLVQHSTKEPPDLASLSPDVSAGLAAAIRKGLSKSPGDRFANCRKFAEVVLAGVSTSSSTKSDEGKAKCPVCQKVLKLPDNARGKTVPCPACASLLRISDDLRKVEIAPAGAVKTGTRAVEVRAVTSQASVRPRDTIGSLSSPLNDRAKATPRTGVAKSSRQMTMSAGQETAKSKPVETSFPIPMQKSEKSIAETLRRMLERVEPFWKNKKQRAVVGNIVVASLVVGITLFILTGNGANIEVALTPESSTVPDDVAVARRRLQKAVTVAPDSSSEPSMAKPKTKNLPPLSDQQAEYKQPPKPSSASAQPIIAKSASPETVQSEKPAVNLDTLISKSAGDSGRLISTATGMEFVLVPAGEFMMGSNDMDVQASLKADTIKMEYYKVEQPQHRVKITQPFYMATHEVTQTQYQQVIGRNPSDFSKSGNSSGQVLDVDAARFPVECVSWLDAVYFCIELSIKENLSPCYRLANIKRREGESIESADVALRIGDGYRLPTEAEWEYACRGGSATPFHFGSQLNGDKANVDGAHPFGTTTKGPYLKRPTTVGSYPANAFGLYDMHGNVSEWCQDWYDEAYYTERSERDPVGPLTGSYRVDRGGGWIGHAHDARAAQRSGAPPGGRGDFVGFRIVISGLLPMLSSLPVQPVIAKSEIPKSVQSKKDTNDSGKLTSKSTGMEFTLIPVGEFMMGSSDADVQTYLKADTKFKVGDYKDEQPQHRVKITRQFFMATHEVTQAQYQQVIGRNPSNFAKTGDWSGRTSVMDTSRFPVERVTWFDAVAFCVRLSEMENRSPCYRMTNIKRDKDQSIEMADVEILVGDGYRLPTEAEWEYACRAGSTTAFHFGSRLNGDKANVNGDNPFGTTTKGPYLARTTTVGSYKANAFGLYDMHGNVWEWCQDWYSGDYYSERVERDPVGLSTGSDRVFRGGGAIYSAHFARAALRFRFSPGLRNVNVGFRVVASSSAR